VLGQVNALAQQIQRETGDVQTLSEEEQALTKEWLEICASLNITLNIQEDIAPWINEQEHYERQLYQLSQRLPCKTS
jgi:exonuclease SbcC